MANKRMGKLGKLSDFGKTHQPEATQPATQKDDTSTQRPTPPANKKLTTVNIKITRGQQEWLANTARLVRDNNTTPVPPSERVYPQHLIGVAIELLRSAGVDWEKVKNLDDLKKHLNL